MRLKEKISEAATEKVFGDGWQKALGGIYRRDPKTGLAGWVCLWGQMYMINAPTFPCASILRFQMAQKQDRR